MKFTDIGRQTSNTPEDSILIPLAQRHEKPTGVRPYAENAPEYLNLGLLQNNLGNCLNIIDDEVMKGYVTTLDQFPIIKPETFIDKDFSDIHFFKITELVYQEDEFSADKLAMLFHTLSNKPCTLVLMLKSDGEKTDFYLGARPNGANAADTLFQMLKQSLTGFFPGSRIGDYFDEDMKKDLDAIEVGCISSVSCVADYIRNEDITTNKDFIQGLEKFVYAVQGKVYTAVLIADNVAHDELMQRKREYEQISSQISPFANMQLNFSVSEGTGTSKGTSDSKTSNKAHTMSSGTTETKTDAITRTIGSSETTGVSDANSDTKTITDSASKGDTHNVSISEGTSETVTDGINVGMYSGVSSNAGLHLGPFSIGAGKNMGVSAGYNHSVAKGTNHTASVSDSISKTLTHGISNSQGHTHGISKGYGTTENEGTSESIGIGTNTGEAFTSGEAFSLVNTEAFTETFGNSRAIILNAQNMTLTSALQRIQKHLERIEECESFGMWNFAAYFLGTTAAETGTAANIYKAVVAGTDSGIERSAVNTWTDEADVHDLFQYIKNFVHPRFAYRGFSYDDEWYKAIDPSVLVSSNELAIHLGLPRHSVRGLPVVEHVPFAQEIISRKETPEIKIRIGKIYHLGEKTNTEVALDANSLAMHTFVTGSTGTGKSNTVYQILSEIKKTGIPFLIVEPAKGEYKNVFKDVRCFGTNPQIDELLRINPFAFPDKIHVLEHIDRIIEIFNVCWPMYAAMPAVLKEAVERAYISAGWDLDLSANLKVQGLFPTFDDVLRELNETINSSAYSADTKGDYIGSLSTRLRSLTNGINGRIFTSDEIDLNDLFDRNAIIDISRVGAIETKSLIMGIIVLKLQEYRMANATGMNNPLRHITVLEEAHNLLKKTSTEQSADSANLIGKSVEMLTNTIAEVRTYGEGFVIVDQAPNLLDTAVIRNTNTKIVMRLPESNDREVAGGAISLKDQQLDELSRIPNHIAAVYQNDWQEAVLCEIYEFKPEKYDSEDTSGSNLQPIIGRRDYQKILRQLLKKNLSELEKNNLVKEIKGLNCSAKIRRDLITNLGKHNRVLEWSIADFINKYFDLSDVFRGTSNCRNLEQLCEMMRQNIQDEFQEFTEEEMLSVLYYVCRIEHEKYPDNQAIEQLRTEYLKGKVM